MENETGFKLTVNISAEAWGIAQRRLAFLEVVIAQILKDDHSVKEWYTARELAALNLPGLGENPATIQSLGYHRSWAYITAKRNGRMVNLYHYASLPQAAFEAFIHRIVAIPESDNLDGIEYDTNTRKEDEPEPQWLLPLMRIIKGRAETGKPHIGTCKALYRMPAPCLNLWQSKTHSAGFPDAKKDGQLPNTFYKTRRRVTPRVVC